MLLRKRTQYIVLQLEMHWKGARCSPFYFTVKSSYNYTITNSKNQCLQGFCFVTENIRTFHIKKYELFNQMIRERGVLQWQTKRQEH